MKTIKKIILLFTTLALIFSLSSWGSAAQYDNYYAIFLREKGIMVGSGNDLMLDSKFSVEQLFAVLARISGQDTIARNFTKSHSFKDVPKDRWSNSYIAWAQDRGLTLGKEDGTVGYLDNISGQRLAMFLLRALGNDDISWDKAFEVAKSKGLFDEVEILPTEELTRDKVTKIVYLALDTQTTLGNKLGEHIGINILERSINTGLQKKFSFYGISIGDTEKWVLQILGQPSRKDLSEYGFEWYIYNQDYKRYIQVGIHQGKVVGIYTNTGSWTSKEGIKIGSSREDVVKAYGTPLEYILKDNTRYFYNYDKEGDIFLVENYYATIFYDIHNGQRVTAVQLIDRNIEQGLKSYYGSASERLRASYERQIFDIANSTRVRFGKEPFTWDEAIASTARKHSADMAANNFFDHLNPKGESPFDRMERDGIRYRMAGENIAAGQANAIVAHEAWMNSSGHRKNVLGDFARLGVGVEFGGNYRIYYTQKFYTPSR